MAPLANTTDNSGWFPPGAEPSEGWRVDAVTLALLVIIGDARSEDLTRAMTATRLAILPRLVPAMQLLSPVRPARLPRANATLAAIHGPTPDEVFRKKTIGYFVNVLHGMDDMQRLGFRVLEVKHNTQKKNQDLESANVKFASVPPSRLVRGVLIFSSALTLGLFIAAIAWQNGPAALAVAFMGISSSLMGHASSWRPGTPTGSLGPRVTRRPLSLSKFSTTIGLTWSSFDAMRPLVRSCTRVASITARTEPEVYATEPSWPREAFL